MMSSISVIARRVFPNFFAPDRAMSIEEVRARVIKSHDKIGQEIAENQPYMR